MSYIEKFPGGFSPSVNHPLDARNEIDDITSADSTYLETAYVGMVTYDKNTKKHYKITATDGTQAGLEYSLLTEYGSATSLRTFSKTITPVTRAHVDFPDMDNGIVDFGTIYTSGVEGKFRVYSNAIIGDPSAQVNSTDTSDGMHQFIGLVLSVNTVRVHAWVAPYFPRNYDQGGGLYANMNLDVILDLKIDDVISVEMSVPAQSWAGSSVLTLASTDLTTHNGDRDGEDFYSIMNVLHFQESPTATSVPVDITAWGFEFDRAPTTSDNTALNPDYVNGQIWTDRTNGAKYICVNGTAGLWERILTESQVPSAESTASFIATEATSALIGTTGDYDVSWFLPANFNLGQQARILVNNVSYMTLDSNTVASDLPSKIPFVAGDRIRVIDDTVVEEHLLGDRTEHLNDMRTWEENDNYIFMADSGGDKIQVYDKGLGAWFDADPSASDPLRTPLSFTMDRETDTLYFIEGIAGDAYSWRVGNSTWNKITEEPSFTGNSEAAHLHFSHGKLFMLEDRSHDIWIRENGTWSMLPDYPSTPVFGFCQGISYDGESLYVATEHGFPIIPLIFKLKDEVWTDITNHAGAPAWDDLGDLVIYEDILYVTMKNFIYTYNGTSWSLLHEQKGWHSPAGHFQFMRIVDGVIYANNRDGEIIRLPISKTQARIAGSLKPSTVFAPAAQLSLGILTDRDPTSADDVNSSEFPIAINQQWFNSTTGDQFVATSVAAGNAVWERRVTEKDLPEGRGLFSGTFISTQSETPAIGDDVIFHGSNAAEDVLYNDSTGLRQNGSDTNFVLRAGSTYRLSASIAVYNLGDPQAEISFCFRALGDNVGPAFGVTKGNNTGGIETALVEKSIIYTARQETIVSVRVLNTTGSVGYTGSADQAQSSVDSNADTSITIEELSASLYQPMQTTTWGITRNRPPATDGSDDRFADNENVNGQMWTDSNTGLKYLCLDDVNGTWDRIVTESELPIGTPVIGAATFTSPVSELISAGDKLKIDGTASSYLSTGATDVFKTDDIHELQLRKNHTYKVTVDVQAYNVAPGAVLQMHGQQNSLRCGPSFGFAADSATGNESVSFSKSFVTRNLGYDSKLSIVVDRVTAGMGIAGTDNTTVDVNDANLLGETSVTIETIPESTLISTMQGGWGLQRDDYPTTLNNTAADPDYVTGQLWIDRSRQKAHLCTDGVNGIWEPLLVANDNQILKVRDRGNPSWKTNLSRGDRNTYIYDTSEVELPYSFDEIGDRYIIRNTTANPINIVNGTVAQVAAGEPTTIPPGEVATILAISTSRCHVIPGLV